MPQASQQDAETIVLAPNCSLSPRGATLFFGGVCAGAFGVASLLALRGFWPVLPFAGLEMLVLGWALWVSMRRQQQFESILITDERIEIESHTHSKHQRIVFPRHWSQVKLRRAELTLHPSTLTIESHGRSFELGKFLTEEERRGLAERLQRSIGRMNESPPLGQQDCNTRLE
jgi:uncharacterized membrane protein